MIGKLRKQLSGAALLILLLSLTGAAFGQPNNNDASQVLEGAWMVTITENGNQWPMAFTKDGIVMVANVPFDNLGQRVGSGLGAWIRTGNREFALTFVFNLVSLDFPWPFTGTFKDRARVKLNETRDEFEGQLSFELLDPLGNVIFGGQNTITGKKIKVEPLAP